MSAKGGRVGGVGGDRSGSGKAKTPKQVSESQSDRQTEYIKNGGRGEKHLHWTPHSRTKDRRLRAVQPVGPLKPLLFVLSFITFIHILL